MAQQGFLRRSVAILLALLLTHAAVGLRAEEVDRRKADVIILMDISGSMVNDIRSNLVHHGMATGRQQADGYFPPDYFRIARGFTIESALADPRMESVVTNNLLYKVILYAEAIIDQPWRQNIYLATFDDGPIDMGVGGGVGQPRSSRNILGPFIMDGGSPTAGSPGRTALKSLLAPDRNGLYAGFPKWRGILAEAVMKGSGPTAIHGTCLIGLSFLDSLIIPGYTNSTGQQKMILFTDGLEEKDKSIPFTRTIDFLKLHRSRIAFEFDKYFISRPGEPVPPVVPTESAALRAAGFPPIQLFKPRAVRVTMSVDGGALAGKLEEPEDQDLASEVVLSPSVRIQALADDRQPLRGWLKFSVSQIPDAEIEIVPAQVPVQDLSQPITFKLRAKGKGLKALYQSESKLFDKLLLQWQLFAENESASQVRAGGELSMAFYGPDRWPISLELLPRVYPVELRCLQPAGITLAPGSPIQISPAVRKGTLLVFEADFSKTRGAASLLVRLKDFKAGSGFKFASGNGDQMLLSRSPGDGGKAEFSIISDLPPGTPGLSATIEILPQSQWVRVNTSQIDINAVCEPSVVKADWLAKGGDAAFQPAQIDFGIVYMQGAEGGVPNVRTDPPTQLLSVEIEDSCVLPVAEPSLTGSNPEAFRLVFKSDAGGGEGSQLINRSVRIEVQPKHVYYGPTQGTTQKNFTAVFELRPRGNYLFETRLDAGTVIRTNLIALPLSMNAFMQQGEGNPPK